VATEPAVEQPLRSEFQGPGSKFQVQFAVPSEKLRCLELGTGIVELVGPKVAIGTRAYFTPRGDPNGISQAEGGSEARWYDAQCEVAGEESAARRGREGRRGEAQRESEKEERIAARWCAQGRSEALARDEQLS
jgi:hypothetical protein